ncbi:hypothetical protein DQG23_27970 [Paenibacillus contaminans]|uniref:Uncharacterized protein n=1 Tax=Paenibacillus contaminans TaxID=450362 RepID=A0A329MAI9_9BACL|nr:hypothetical protein DQG23_27970 [Paenibacillus contaminans]
MIMQRTVALIMRKRLLFVRQTSLFQIENPCFVEVMRQMQLLVSQTKLIVAFASLMGENEHVTCEIVRTAS